MGFVLLSHIESAQSGNGSGSRLAVDGQALSLLEGLDLAAGGTEVVSVLHVEAAKTVCRDELFQLADVVADPAVFEYSSEDELPFAVRDIRLRPEGRPAVNVPAAFRKRSFKHTIIAAFCFNHVESVSTT